MRRAWFVLFLLTIFVLRANAQMGKSISLAAGSPEDKAFSAISAAGDPAQKIALLDQFMKDFGGKPDLALLADQLYASAYLDAKDYDKAIESGEKVLAADPDNFPAAMILVRAAQGKGDAEKVFDYGDKAVAIAARYKAAPPPAGVSADQWKQQQDETEKAAASDLEFIQYAEFTSAYQVKDGTMKAALLERFLKTYPGSSYASNAVEALAFAYQQANNTPKMIETAQQALAKDPANVSILLLLADNYSDKGQHIEEAAADAQKALNALASAKKPDAVNQADWDKQTALQKGMAYSILGHVNVIRGRNAQAVPLFKQASPLLQPYNFYNGRNLYLLGFTLAKMEQYAEAGKYLRQAVAVDSPYRSLAQQTLAKIPGGTSPGHKSRNP